MKTGNTNIVIATQVDDETLSPMSNWWLEGPGYGGLNEQEIEELESLSGESDYENLVAQVELILANLQDASIVSEETAFCYAIYVFIWDDETESFELHSRFPTGGGFTDHMKWFAEN